MEHKADIAIAGAGLTGRLMALALAHTGQDVILIDPAPQNGSIRDGRTTALAFASVRLFQRLDLWEPLAADAGEITDIVVTNGAPADRFRPGRRAGHHLHFPSTLLTPGKDGSPLGHIVENAAMNTLFAERVEANERITTIFGQGVSSVEPTTGRTILTLSEGDTVAAQLLIACDGKFSRLRDRFGIRTIRRPYDQKAIIFNVKHDLPHGGVAHEMFYPSGPFAILPMQGNRSSIVWTEDAATADAFMALDESQVLAAARQRIGDHLGDIRLVSDRAIYPLSLIFAPHPVGDRFALAGDAAHSIHPIAGQGFNLGVKDIAAMADVVAETAGAGLDVGHGTMLEKYARWRGFDAGTMSLGTDAMNHLFSNDLAPVRMARSFGLGIVNAIDPARRAFMRHAGADLGDLPRLMQPLREGEASPVKRQA
ncbi:FAD-dependent monooxygenase [Parvularcula sp. LCG005]|uniref:FAD-dependent monooxygenase n=1 Tax=Parvularcula sp. LCG005 TaxID=3078805 RepID=UPI0029424F3D|nr:FAD-dependent monooxygenase [Parvularcula sp. LCG005]WOI53389.1 FAD-dependent monooxygenase [Parvularcula sp. LCG005]